MRISFNNIINLLLLALWALILGCVAAPENPEMGSADASLDPPAGPPMTFGVTTLIINSGATYTNTPAAASIAYTTIGPVAEICILIDTSDVGTCAWTAPSSPLIDDIGADGPHTAYAWAKDIDGNISVATTDTIIVDTAIPTVNGVTSSSADGPYNLASGGAIGIVVSFSEVVNVTGSPQLLLETGAADQYATYLSGSGTSSLTFTYAVAAGDQSLDLDYVGTASLEFNGGNIEDPANNAASLTLVTPAAANSLGFNQAIVIDTTDPTIPTGLTPAGATMSNDGGTTITWTDGTDPGGSGIDLHNLKMCTVNDCATGCTASSVETSPAGWVGLTNGNTYYGCVQVVDLAGNSSAFIATAGTVTVDMDLPTVTGVTSSSANGYYNVASGTAIGIVVDFSEAVSVTGLPQILLETGTTDRNAIYASGSGSSSLTFTYTVVDGDATTDLDYAGTTSLDLNSGTIKDSANNAATLILATPGEANSLGDNQLIRIDTEAPTGTVNKSGGQDDPTNVASIVYVFVFNEPVIGLTEADVTRSGATTIDVGTGTSVYTVTATGLTDGDVSVSLGAATVTDLAGNFNLASTSTDNVVAYDSTAPTVATGLVWTETPPHDATSINPSWTLSGSGDLASQEIQLYDAASCGNLLNGPIARSASDVSYGPVFGNNGSTYSYKITSYDSAGNSSISACSTDMLIDTTAPTVASVSSSTGDATYKIGDVITITVNFSEAVIVTGTPKILLETGTTDIYVNFVNGSTTSTLEFSYTISPGEETLDLDYVATNSLELNGGTIRDAAENDAVLTLATPGAVGSIADSKAIVVDGIVPTVTIAKAIHQNNPTADSVDIEFTVIFSEPVNGFIATDVSTGGTATYSITSVDGANGASVYSIYALATAAGDLTPTVDASSITDLAGNNNSAASAITSDATVTYDASCTVASANWTAYNESGNSCADAGANVCKICSEAQLQDVANKCGGGDATTCGLHFTLHQNLNLVVYNSGFPIVGDLTNKFFGSFQGNGFKISNLYINQNTTDYVGLFGYITGAASISDLHLTNLLVKGQNKVGGLVGYMDGTSVVTLNSVMGSVTGIGQTGGMIGWQASTTSTITSCYFSGSVYGDNEVGGLIGHNNGPINTSFSSGSVYAASDFVGGLTGYADDVSADIDRSYSSSVVVGASDGAGGLVGYFSGGTISDSFATGAVQGANGVGGLIGHLDFASSVIQNSYSSGKIMAGGVDRAGFIGRVLVTPSTSSNNFWNTDSSGLGISHNGAAFAAVSSATMIEMQDGTIKGALGGNWKAVSDIAGYGLGAPVLDILDYLAVSPYCWENARASAWIDYNEAGAGTNGDPYRICNSMQLNALPASSSAYFALEDTVDIGFYDDSFNQITNFSGDFNGNGFTISGFRNSKAVTDSVGLFNDIQGGSVYDLNLLFVNVLGKDFVGALAGKLTSSASISNVVVTGRIQGEDYIGGVVGYAPTGTIDSATVMGVVEGFSLVGGLVGYNSADISNSAAYLVGKIAPGASNNSLGGLVGNNSTPGSITTSLAGGILQNYGTNGKTGGLVGYNSGAISLSSFNGNVTNETLSGDNIGGLVGYHAAGGTIITSFSIGEVTNSTTTGVNTGGLVGMALGDVGKSFSHSLVDGASRNVGGLVGNADSATIDQSYASGDVTAGGNHAGALLGTGTSVTVTDSYATGNVDGVACNYSVNQCVGSTQSCTDVDTGNVGTPNGAVTGTVDAYYRDIANTTCYINTDGATAWTQLDVTGKLIGDSRVVAGGITGSYYYSGSTCANCGVLADYGTAEATLANFYDDTNAIYTSWDFGTDWFDNVTTYPTLQ